MNSAPGHGASFEIYLPAIGGLTRPESGRPTDAPGETETVSAVVDEVTVWMLACLLLRRGGYEVLDASNGPEALGVASRCRRAISLLATDEVMPV